MGKHRETRDGKRRQHTAAATMEALSKYIDGMPNKVLDKQKLYRGGNESVRAFAAVNEQHFATSTNIPMERMARIGCTAAFLLTCVVMVPYFSYSMALGINKKKN